MMNYQESVKIREDVTELQRQVRQLEGIVKPEISPLHRDLISIRRKLTDYFAGLRGFGTVTPLQTVIRDFEHLLIKFEKGEYDS